MHLVDNRDGIQVFPGMTRTHIIVPLILTLLQKAHLASSDSLDTEAPWSVWIDHDSDTSLVRVANEGSRVSHSLLAADSDPRTVSSVVCRQLGMGPPLIQRGVAYSASPDDVAISCGGSELSIDSCQKLVTENGGTYYGVHIGECLPLQLQTVEDYVIVLSRSNYSSLEGVPLVYMNGQWYPICVHSTLHNAGCRELGLGDQLYTGISSGDEFPNISGYPFIRCGPSADSLSECLMDVCSLTGSYLSLFCLPSPDGDASRFSFSSSLWLLGVIFVFVFIFGFRTMKHQALERQSHSRRTRSVTRSDHRTTESTAGPGLAQEPVIPDDRPPSYPGVIDAAYPPAPMLNTYPPPLSEAAYPPSASDPELPSYEQAVGQQRS